MAVRTELARTVKRGVQARRLRSLACAALLPVLLSLPGRAAGAVENGAGPNDTAQVLYRDALRSIAEGRKNDALDTLRQVVLAEPGHAGAWLDLALLQCSLGDRDEAERLFTRLERDFDPPPAIGALIADARRTGCTGWQAPSQLNLSLGRGHSSNVNQGSTGVLDVGVGLEVPLIDGVGPRADHFTALTGDYLRELTSNGTTGFAQFQVRRHDRLGEYDTGALLLGIDTPWRHGGWTVRASATLTLISLGSHYYQQQAQLQGRLTPPLPLPRGMKFDIVGTLSRVHYPQLAEFDGITGELRGQLAWRHEAAYASASAGWLVDHARAADRPGGDRHGWLVSAMGRHRLPRETIGEVSYARQAWRGATPYASGLIDTVRHQNLSTWRASLSYPVTRNLHLVIEGRSLKNRENIAIFGYSDRQLQLSWQWQRP